MPPGTQAVQAAHAALAFAAGRPALAAEWAAGDGILILLAADDTAALHHLIGDLDRAGHPWAAFREPDLGGALTAVAVLGARRECSPYPLALREEVRP